MNRNDVNTEIENYLNRVRRVLPDSFETDDLVDDIRVHILESLKDKQDANPSSDSIELVREVLNTLGEPEEIAKEWGKVQTFDEEEETESQLLKTIAKQSIAIIVVVAAAWFISTIPNSIVDFWTALIILLIFVVAEYFLRTWQKIEVSKIEAEAERGF